MSNLKQLMEFCNTWEKNFDSSLKAIKKFKEDIGTRPILPTTTEQKYIMHLNLLQLEITETLELFGTQEQPKPHQE